MTAARGIPHAGPRLGLALATLLAFAALAPAFAGAPDDWTLTLVAPDKVQPPGGSATWSGTIVNNTGAPLAFDAAIDFGVSPESNNFTIDFAAAFVALDLVVPPGGYSGPIFEVTWAPNVLGGTFGAGQLELSSGGTSVPAQVAAPFSLGTPGVGPFCTRGTGALGSGSSVAANDSTGRPFVVVNTPAGGLDFVAFDGTTWSSSPIATGIGTQANPSLVLDPDLHPHVAYFDATAGRLVHAWNAGAGWQSETVEAGGVGAAPSLHVDGLGQLHVSYHDGPRGDLRYASRAGASWVAEAVDTAGTQGARSSVATDETGQPFVAYFDGTNGDLRVARRSGSVWLTEAVDTAGTVGEAPSLRWRDGELSVSYRDATPGTRALRYATGSPGAWTTEVVDGAGDPGAESALDHNAFGQPRIAYFDAASASVKFATRIGATWTKEPVATGASASVSLDRSATDEPFLSWTDAGTGEVRFGALNACASVDVPVVPAHSGGGLTLYPSRPNPFAGSTVIAFALARGSVARVRVYDTAGRVAAELLNGPVAAGAHEVRWNGTGRGGRALPPGSYIAEVRAGGLRRTMRLVLLR